MFLDAIKIKCLSLAYILLRPFSPRAAARMLIKCIDIHVERCRDTQEKEAYLDIRYTLLTNEQPARAAAAIERILGR